MTDQILREAVRGLADEARAVPGLADAARRQGRHIRGRRRAGVGIGIVAVAATIAIVVAPDYHATRHHPPVSSTPSPTPPVRTLPTPTTLTETGSVTLAGGWQILGVGNWVLDGTHYRAVQPPPNSEILPSPDGQLVAVITLRDSDVVLDIQRANGTHVRTIHPGDVSGFVWSPRSDRLLAEAAGPKDPFRLPGYAIIDVATGSVTTRWPHYEDCSECQFVWTRDGTGLALALPDRRGGEDELVSSVDVFDAATGALRASLPITGMPLDPFAWSPDGRYVIGRVSLDHRTYALFDLRAGTSTPFPCDGRFVDSQTIVCAPGRAIDTYRPDGTLVAETMLGGALAGHGVTPHVTLGPGR